MKPHLMKALSKELYSYIKLQSAVDKQILLEINKKLLKMQIEVSEILEKITWFLEKIFAKKFRFVRKNITQKGHFVRIAR